MNHDLLCKQNTSSDFPLPGEVFRIPPKRGRLAVYLFLVRWLSERHDGLSCSIVSQSLHLGKRTVKKHLRALVADGLILLEERGDDLAVTLCPIADKFQKEEAEQLQIRMPRTPRVWRERVRSARRDDDWEPLPL